MSAKSAKTPKDAPPPPEGTFEDRLEELNTLIAALERGDLGLEESIKTFERGRALHRDLLARLEAFERRIETLAKGPDGKDAEAPAKGFDPDADHEDGDEIPF